MLALEMAFFWLNGSWVSGTVAVTPVVALSNVNGQGLPGQGSYASWLISAGDGDTVIVFPHGFKQTAPSGNPSIGFIPDYLRIEDIASAAGGATPFWGVTADATNITLTKQGTVGSGGTPQAKLVAWRPHSHIE